MSQLLFIYENIVFVPVIRGISLIGRYTCNIVGICTLLLLFIYFFLGGGGTLVTDLFFCHSVFLGTSSSGFIYMYLITLIVYIIYNESIIRHLKSHTEQNLSDASFLPSVLHLCFSI